MSVMTTSPIDVWVAARRSFADQFAQDSNGIFYRQGQSGEAIKITAEEHRRFIEGFNQGLRQTTKMIYLGAAFGIGLIAVISTINTEIADAFGILAIGIAIAPGLMFYRSAWSTPARELAGRTPTAGERAPRMAKRSKFQLVTYRQLLAIAAGGLTFPFMGSPQSKSFLGLNPSGLAFGSALVALAAVQALRKWRFERGKGHG